MVLAIFLGGGEREVSLQNETKYGGRGAKK